MCAMACPEVFELSDEDGHAHVREGDIPASLSDAVDQARRSCPEGAISID
jgi:ferredoxin